MRFLNRLADTLFTDQELRLRFVSAFEEDAPYIKALLWLEEPPSPTIFPPLPIPSPLPPFISIVDGASQPGSHELHHRGAYYVLDPSSALCASVICGVDLSPSAILDLCAAPGGKSIFAWRYCKPQLLVSNEVARKRASALISNLTRCHIAPALVTGRDPAIFSEHLPESFPLVLVDAPCSGQSLLRKGFKNSSAFHPVMIKRNVGRQRRIIANAVKLLPPGGTIAYMTCTYSLEENEEVIAWTLDRFPGMSAVEVGSLREYRSSTADFPCYRVYPWHNLGAGGFAALLRREGKLVETPTAETSAALEDLGILWSSDSR